MFKIIKVTHADGSQNFKTITYTPEIAKDYISKKYVKIYNEGTPTTLILVAPEISHRYYYDEVKRVYHMDSEGLTQVIGATRNGRNWAYYSDPSKVPTTAVKYNNIWYISEAYLLEHEDLKVCKRDHEAYYYHKTATACRVCKSLSEQQGNPLYVYHSAPRATTIGKTGATDILVGCEIEKEDNNVTWDKKELLKAGYIMERDSSLDYDGYELITKPIIVSLTTPVKDQAAVTEYLTNDLVKPLINARATSKCGGHIHFSKIDLKPKELLFTIRNYLPLLYALYEKRASNEYCKMKSLNEMLNYNERRWAFNFTSYNTMEVRLLPAVVNSGNLIWRIELFRIFFTTPCSNVLELVKMLEAPEHHLTKHLLKGITPTSLLHKIRIAKESRYLALMNEVTLNKYKHLLTLTEYRAARKELLKTEVTENRRALWDAREELKVRRAELFLLHKSIKVRKVEMLQSYKNGAEQLTNSRKYKTHFKTI